ncbi:MAG: hypothetical protein IPG76_21820 [Acidobacteria bacterium]|nr:hypothetical protein [Acidobacteriota bacterium]
MAKWDEAALLAGDFRHGGMIDIEKVQSDYRTMAFTTRVHLVDTENPGRAG